jgi:Derlin-2/3
MLVDVVQGSPITKTFLATAVGLGILTACGVIAEVDIFYSPKMIFKYGEVWRFLTSLCYFGDFNIHTLVNMMSFLTFSAPLETGVFTGSPEDFLMFLFFGSSFAWLFGNLMHMVFLRKCVVSYALYYWSKHFGDLKIRMFALPFELKAQYMPFASLVMSFMMGGPLSCLQDMIGFVAAHLFFFVRDVVGTQYNISLLRAPKWLQRAAGPLKSL